MTISASTAMPGAYDYGEVARSVLIAMAASYAALDLTERVTAAKGRVRVFWLSGGATAMGIGIWAMHFKGMLAFHLPVPVAYHWPTVLASLLVAVFASAVALFVASRRKMGRTEALIGSVIMGGAIAGMHYIGVAAMRLPAITRFSPWLATSSILLAILFSLIALRMAFGLREETEWTFRRGFGSALVMGVAISAMHYTGMAAVSFIPAPPPDLSRTVSISPLGNFGVVLATLLVLLAAVVTSSADKRAERNRAEEAVRRSEKELRDVIDTVPVNVWSALPDGSVDFVNQRWQEFTGLPPEDALGWNWETVVHPDDRSRFGADWHAALKNAQPMESEVRVRRKDGEYRWLFVRNVPLRDEVGNIVKWYGTGVDVEDRKRAEEALRRSENELREMFEMIPAIAFSTAADGSQGRANRRWREYTGVAPQWDSLGGVQPDNANWREATRIHPEDLDGFVKSWLDSMSTCEPFEHEARLRGANGEYRWFLIRAVPVCDEQGNVLKWYGIDTDIEDRKQAETLLTGEKRILEMVAKGNSLPQILDSLCRLVEEQASGVLASILLVDGDRLRHGGAPSLPKAYTDAIDGAVIGPAAGSCGTAAYRREQVIVEDIATDPLWADYRPVALPHSLRACWSTPVFSSQGKVIATFAMYYREPRSPSPRDQEIIEQITHLAGVAIERKQTQEALGRSEAYLREAQRLSKTGSWVWSPSTGEPLYWSEETFRIYGFDSQRGLPTGEKKWERVHPEDRDSTVEKFRNAAREKREYVHDHRIMLPDGTVKHIHAIAHPVVNQAGEVIEFVGTSIDVTERKRAEEDVRAAESRFRASVDHLKDALFIHDDQDDKGRVIDVNQQACDSLGYTREELIGMTAFDYDPSVDVTFNLSIRERLARGESFSFESVHRRKDGTEFPVEVRVRPFWHGDHRFGLALARDITDRKRAEAERERLRQLEADLAHMNRVSMTGELAASLAHEIKQPIAAAATDAKTCLRWLQREPPDIDEAREAVSRIFKDVIRAADIIDRNRALYRRDTPRREMLNLNELIREMIALLHDAANRHVISIRTELDGALPTITADRVQLQQVLMNLMLNGIEAMKDTGDELSIRSKKTEDGQILLSVSDLGVGLPGENAERIFDAFFTTKAQGTGMGLSISRRIIESHGGRLWATANSGRGATFHFTLPTAEEVKVHATGT